MARIGPLDPLRRDLEEIRKASDRCAALTRQLLAFSRKQILVPKVINLGDVVADMDKMLRRLIGEDIDLVSVGGKDLWNVKADPGQVEQVIVNLVVNARDAMPGGGKLTIEASNVVLDETYTSGHQYVSPGSYVLLAVSDTGSGMDEGTVARIFEPFFTTKEKGTGLGLSTVYGIVKQSGGHINVYSEPGIGTTFKMYFPAVEERVTESSGAGALPSEELRGGETVLVVEDEELVRQMVREILVQYGYTVVEAQSGGEAVDLCSRRQGTIHLMLTDVVMPGMNGVELSKRLAPMQPEMKVLFMSGYTADAIVHQGILDPGIAFIHKPFTMDSLAHKVREVLGPGGDELNGAGIPAPRSDQAVADRLIGGHPPNESRGAPRSALLPFRQQMRLRQVHPFVAAQDPRDPLQRQTAVLEDRAQAFAVERMELIEGAFHPGPGQLPGEKIPGIRRDPGGFHLQQPPLSIRILGAGSRGTGEPRGSPRRPRRPPATASGCARHRPRGSTPFPPAPAAYLRRAARRRPPSR